jgi:hypothetical protein
MRMVGDKSQPSRFYAGLNTAVKPHTVTNFTLTIPKPESRPAQHRLAIEHPISGNAFS